VGVLVGLLVGVARPAVAQDVAPLPPPVDSITVEGNSRVSSEQISTVAGIVLGATISYRDVQRAIRALFSTGQFDDVRIEQRNPEGLLVIAIIVTERPVLRSWTVEGPERISPREVRDRVTLVPGRALDRAALARSTYAIDSMYRAEGYYSARLDTVVTPTDDGGVTVLFKVREGNRVVLSQVQIEGNTEFPDEEIVGAIGSKPEGLWWFRSGKYDEGIIDGDIRQRLPDWYGDRGYVDFQVTGDSLIPDLDNGKAILQLRVEEGRQYRIGAVEILGNRRYSVDELANLLQFVPPEQVGTGKEVGDVFNRAVWRSAVERVDNAYKNNGYIYSSVVAEEARRFGADSTPILDLRLRITEGEPAYVNRVNVVGNDVTHERVIREAIVLIPGQLFNRELLVRSYQNVSNLNFFEQPLPFPDVEPLANGDVDITFRIAERRTGSINFGASIGQGTGLGGFLGLEEPNLFGRGKRGRMQWQFGQNINDFTLNYSDPAIKESRVSGSVSLFNSRQRFIVGDLGRRQQEGGSLQLGLPWLGSRYARVFASYGFQRIRFTEGSADLQSRFQCSPCSRSTVGLSFLRDTRVGLPFPVGGSLISVGRTAGSWAARGITRSSTSIPAGTRRLARPAATVRSVPGCSSRSASPPSQVSFSAIRAASSPNSTRSGEYSSAFPSVGMTSSRSRQTVSTRLRRTRAPVRTPSARGTRSSRWRPVHGCRRRCTSTPSSMPATCIGVCANMTLLVSTGAPGSAWR
jgi:outer membrane protein insertion porin family